MTSQEILDDYCAKVPTELQRWCVTGTGYRGRRNRPLYTSIFAYAKGINVYNGTVWAVWPSGRRSALWTVCN